MRQWLWGMALLGCVGCGESKKPTADQTGGMSATSTGGARAGTGTAGSGGNTTAGSNGNANGGNANGGNANGGNANGGQEGGGLDGGGHDHGGDGNGAGESSAGEASGGAGGLTTPCAGDVTGGWFAVEAAAAKNRPNTVDACFNLSLQRGAGGLLETKQDIWVDYLATPRTTDLRFRAPDMPGLEGTFLIMLRNLGSVVQDYAEACVADGQGQATCAELSDLFTTIGVNQNRYPSVTCIDRALGGCSCTFQVDVVRGPVGFWSPDPNDPHQIVLSRPKPLDPAQLDSHQIPYCVDGNNLEFDQEFAGIYTEPLPLAFERVSCSDGVQGPTEGGPDCDGPCPKSCP